jgi:hypothetical protein
MGPRQLAFTFSCPAFFCLAPIKHAVTADSAEEKHTARTVGIRVAVIGKKRFINAVITIPISIPTTPEIVSLSQEIFAILLLLVPIYMILLTVNSSIVMYIAISGVIQEYKVGNQ